MEACMSAWGNAWARAWGNAWGAITGGGFYSPRTTLTVVTRSRSVSITVVTNYS